MAAPIGNEFYKLRSRHGRHKLFASPKLLWEAACEYFQWVDEHPEYKLEVSKFPIKKVVDRKRVTEYTIALPVKQPYSLEGLCLYWGVNKGYLRDFKAALPPEDKEKDEGFSAIITRVEEIIFTQQYNGASSGFFKENIVSRKLGLKDQSDITTDGQKITTDLSGLSTEDKLLLLEIQRRRSERNNKSS
ncbi:DNA packaging protein [Chitinophaga parva]|uniref:DNA packaging protein n=1 Tax=Chitinophaga parva TaxID=2169414 RepID=A0A2T7BBM1_9BACT|nr:terminase small subunit [Chitinophaga parva]PUZ21794.1 DNA packaging protein [Chitinophaga parva]